MSEVLLCERDGALAIVTLNRPAKRNALSIELRFALAEQLAALAADDEIACVLLTGAGSAFCAGMDVSQFGGDHDHRRQLVDSSVACFEAVARFPKPLVAYVNGPAIAGGFALSLLCDIRVAALEARMGFPELGRHIPPSYAAARAALPDALARELCLTGRLLSAGEARELGVLSDIGGIGAALGIARQIASAPAAATREVKRRVLVAGESTWLALLAEETAALETALLG
ncbi:MAG: hypothetical protein QOG68_604 [Solirubrobacteraceae bacterium]|jgi:enoyl-CoA hydratase|nr:hypothetical protein [Solirubrobacteraceae bacterium]